MAEGTKAAQRKARALRQQDRDLRLQRQVQYYQDRSQMDLERFAMSLFCDRDDPCTYGKIEQEGRPRWCTSTRIQVNPSDQESHQAAVSGVMSECIWGLFAPTFKQRVEKWPETLRQSEAVATSPNRKPWK